MDTATKRVNNSRKREPIRCHVSRGAQRREQIDMSKNRMFGETPKRRLIVSVDDATVAAIDKLIKPGAGTYHPAAGNRSEFVRLAVEGELRRWRAKTRNTSRSGK